MFKTYKAAPDIDVLTASFPIPGLGFIPINAFVLQGPDPILVDTGPGVLRSEFLTTLRSVIDPKSLRWLWLTHPDPDHIGALPALLEENPDLRVATNFLGVGIMGLFAPLPMERVFLLNPGQQLEVGARTLTALRPPAFDNPATMGFRESQSGALFSSDCFGALLPEVPERADDLTEDGLRQGQITWSTIDSPWLHKVDPSVLANDVAELAATDPKLVLSSHLPAAPGTMMKQLASNLTAVPPAPPFVGPDQAALMAMMAG